MKIKKNFALRQVADTWIVMPLAEQNMNLNGMLTLTESGAILWKALEQGCDLDALTNALTAEYDVSAQEAQSDVAEFLSHMRKLGIVTED